MRRLRILAGALGSVPVTLFGLALITFLIGRVVPIDPVLAVVGDRAAIRGGARRGMRWGWTGRCRFNSCGIWAVCCMGTLAVRS